MFKDPASLDKFAGILVGCSVAGAAVTVGAPPAGTGEAMTAAGGLFAVLRGQRATDANRIRKELTLALQAEWQAWGDHSSHAGEGRRASAVASFEQVIAHCAPMPAEVVGLKLDPDAIAARVLARAEKALPVAYADMGKAHAETHIPRQFLLKLTTRAYAHLIAQPGYTDQIAPDLWRGVLGALEEILANSRELLRRIDVLTAELGQMREALEAKAAGVSEDALVRLVKPIAEDVADTGQALIELTRAVEVAKRVQEEGRHGSNLGDFVDEVLRRVAELSAQGDYDAAAARIDAALNEAEAEHKARTLRLLDAGLEQDRLRRNAKAAALRVVRMAEADASGAIGFEALRAVTDEWRLRGRDKGLLFDQEVSIELARLEGERAADADERGTALNDLGISLDELGEREAGTARLEEAVAAYRAALEEMSREQVPLDWARTQMNLGNALRTLGAREAGTARLEEAVAAYRAALQEWTRERVPLDWAMAQMNLGTALRTLGEREAGTARLRQAVAAYRAALEEWMRERVPLDWAGAQMNLGNALRTLGEREAGTARLEEAVAAYRAALEEWMRERVPLDWATAQMNLGNALATLGEREAGTARLEEAVTAYRAALEEWTRERVPLDWAMLQGNMGGVEIAIFDKTDETARLDAAEEHVRAARLVFEAAGATQYLGMAETQLAEIARRREGVAG